jgi:hypothetical protein
MMMGLITFILKLKIYDFLKLNIYAVIGVFMLIIKYICISKFLLSFNIPKPIDFVIQLVLDIPLYFLIVHFIFPSDVKDFGIRIITPLINKFKNIN